MNGKFYLICFIPLSLGANTSMNFSTSKLVLLWKIVNFVPCGIAVALAL